MIKKFKVWDTKLKRWNEDGISLEPKEVYAWDTEGIGLNDLIDFISKKDNGRYKIVQFTGLFDKNGKEIYEGDIVKCRGTIFSEYVNLEVQIFNDNYPGIIMLISKDNHCGIGDVLEDVKVIGNIHENPELLKC